MKITKSMLRSLMDNLNERLERDFPEQNFRVRKIRVKKGKSVIKVKLKKGGK